MKHRDTIVEYYKLMFDDQDVDGWELEIPWEGPDGEWWDVWAFTRCEIVEKPEEICVEISDNGTPVDFNLANFNIPIVSKRLGNLLDTASTNQVQRISTSIGNGSDWEILNVLHSVDCLDHQRSVIDYSTDPNDPGVAKAPKEAGTPRGVRSLRIDNGRADGFHIFRISDWEIPIIVSVDVKSSCEAEGISGVRFQSVS
jgi:hypothetical protein